MAARHVIAAALSDRHEQLRGETFPMDYDGARMVLNALENEGYAVTKTDDGAALPVRRDGGDNPAATPSSPLVEPIRQPRLFELYRHRDISGLSGTGTVAWGAEWPDGTASLRWFTEYPSTVAWDSVEAILAVHGHSGATELVWLTEELSDRVCRACGCTDDTACSGGCFWVAEDLCSQCGDGPGVA